MTRMLMMLGLATAVTAGACNREPDVQKMADGALDSVALNDEVDATYDRDARVVHLSGTVASPGDRSRANDAVHASVNGLAQVANEIVVKGPHAEGADDLDAGIRERFDTVWTNTPELKQYSVGAKVENGVVTLTGDVGSEQERMQAEALTRAIPGVTQVVNAVKVNAESVRKP